MRQKDKIERYLDRLIKKHNGVLQESTSSRYYCIRGRILRVSDHVGKNSDGNISIIFDSSDQGNYIIHGHSSGNISILNYEQTKEFVRNFVRVSFLFKEVTTPPVNSKVVTVTSDGMFNQKVADYLVTTFSKKQFKQILSFLKITENKRKQYSELLKLYQKTWPILKKV